MPLALIGFAVERLRDIGARDRIRSLQLEMANRCSAAGDDGAAREIEDQRTGERIHAAAAVEAAPAADAVGLVKVDLARDAIAEAKIAVDIDGNGDWTKAALKRVGRCNLPDVVAIFIEHDDVVLAVLQNVNAAFEIESDAGGIHQCGLVWDCSVESFEPASGGIEDMDQTICVVGDVAPVRG